MAEQANDQNEKIRKEMQRRIKAMQIEQQKRELVKRYMTTEAYERLMNVRISNFELYSQLADIILAMAQGKRITSKMTEPQLKEILARLTYRPESRIEFKHK